MALINTQVLISGADFFTDEFAINPYYGPNAIDTAAAVVEHQKIKAAFETAGIKMEHVAPPEKCQDGVYTANWALVRGDTAVLSSLPNKRQAEMPYAKEALEKLGKKVIEAPYHFSGQGDALPCGNLLFMGSRYRTDPRMHHFVADKLGYTVIGLQTIPLLDNQGKPVINKITGWADSFFYDIDLALAVLTPNLIAWCPEAFVPDSQAKIRNLSVDTIEVSFDEATQGLACNLVSTSETVIMSANAPKLKAAIEAKGLHTITPQNVKELAKGGGFIRCISLTLNND